MVKGTGMKSGITVTLEAWRRSVAFASLYVERISSDSCNYEKKGTVLWIVVMPACECKNQTFERMFWFHLHDKIKKTVARRFVTLILVELSGIASNRTVNSIFIDFYSCACSVLVWLIANSSWNKEFLILSYCQTAFTKKNAHILYNKELC